MSFAARLCQRAILIDHGRVIADGNTAKIIGDAELMQRHGLETASGI
jgi:cobalt/nickel transport system ATP-binding protein